MPNQTDYSALSTQLVAAARRDPDAGINLLRKTQPALVAQIQTDAMRRGPLKFWGRSRNVDELTGTTIVDPAILTLISRLTRKTLSKTTPHAGLQHTYGYLFSTIETPHGFKRDRWLETDIETAFGLHPTTLSPEPHQGTLLANATWLTGTIAFRDNAQSLKTLQEYLNARAAPDVAKLDPKTWQHHRLSETVNIEWRHEQRSWTLQTDSVTPSAGSSFSLLVYSVVDHHSNAHQLITLFPIGAATRKEILERATKRHRDDIRARFNAYVPAMSVKAWPGRCQLKTFAQ
ncbi:MAG: hypothetical protein R3C59_08220 [Planctomycetaceae bacterium]